MQERGGKERERVVIGPACSGEWRAQGPERAARAGSVQLRARRAFYSHTYENPKEPWEAQPAPCTAAANVASDPAIVRIQCMGYHKWLAV